MILKGIIILGIVGGLLTLLAVGITAMANRVATTNRGMRRRH